MKRAASAMDAPPLSARAVAHDAAATGRLSNMLSTDAAGSSYPKTGGDGEDEEPEDESPGQADKRNGDQDLPYISPSHATAKHLSQAAKDEMLITTATLYLSLRDDQRWGVVRAKFYMRSGVLLSSQSIQKRVKHLYDSYLDKGSVAHAQLTEELRTLLDALHNERQAIQNGLLLEVVLDVRPFGHGDGTAERWEAVADAYHARLDSLDGFRRLTGKELRDRTERLRTVYLDVQCDDYAKLSLALRNSLEQYNRACPRTKRSIDKGQDTQQQQQSKRSRRASNPELETLHVEYDTRMVRKFLDGCFSIQQATKRLHELHGEIATLRGRPAWRTQDVQDQIDWLLSVYEDADHQDHAALIAHPPLCEMLEDVNACVSRIRPYLAILNRRCTQPQDRRSFDDLLLEKVRELRPFSQANDFEEHAVWDQITTELNRLLQATVLFTRDSCASRFRLLRDVQRKTVWSSIVNLTAAQRETLAKIEELMKDAPTWAPVAPHDREEELADVAISIAPQAEPAVAPTRAPPVPENNAQDQDDDENVTVSSPEQTESQDSDPRNEPTDGIDRDVVMAEELTENASTLSRTQSPPRTVQDRSGEEIVIEDSNPSESESESEEFMIQRGVVQDGDEIVIEDSSPAESESEPEELMVQRGSVQETEEIVVEHSAESESQPEEFVVQATDVQDDSAEEIVVEHSSPAQSESQPEENLVQPGGDRAGEDIVADDSSPAQSQSQSHSQSTQSQSDHEELLPPCGGIKDRRGEEIVVDDSNPARSPSEPVQEKPVFLSEDSDVLTRILHAVDTSRPFQAGERELLTWDKIRSDVNFDVGREVISDRESCRQRVVALVQAVKTQDQGRIAQLTVEQRQLLDQIIHGTTSPVDPMGGDQDTERTQGSGHARAGRVPAQYPLLRGGRGGGGRGRGRGRGPHVAPTVTHGSCSQSQLALSIAESEARMKAYMDEKLRTVISEEALKQYVETQAQTTTATMKRLLAEQADATHETVQTLASTVAAITSELDAVKKRFVKVARAFGDDA